MTERDQHELSFLRGPLLERALRVAQVLAETARIRDVEGGTAKTERDLLRQSGLLGALVDKELGGDGASWPELFDMVRLFARVDSSLAHLFGFQHLLLATSRLFGTREQWVPLHRGTVEERWFWGNALNPLDPGTRITRQGSAFRVNGRKSFCSGSVDADRLIISANDAETNKLVVAAVPARRPGIHVLGDWDNMGQRQTDSGAVEFHDLVVEESEILATPGPLGSIFAGLRPLIAQLTLVNIYVGLAEGALEAARTHTLSASKGWSASGLEHPRQDPYVLRHYGEFFVAIEGARTLANRAAEAFESAYRKEDALGSDERGRVAIRVATAKATATKTALDVTAGIFDVAGARATTRAVNLDRFWRNARTHTLHDPWDYKLRELGEFALTDTIPKPSFYS